MFRQVGHRTSVDRFPKFDIPPIFMIKLDTNPISVPMAAVKTHECEAELLLCCSHTQIDAARQKRLQALVRQPLDWDYIIERATHHNILPLLDRQLHHIDDLTIPSQIRTQLRTNFERNFQNNLRLTLELVKLSRSFTDRSIPMLAFKGPVLAQQVYGNLGLRQFVDLDILVPETDVIRTSHLLIESGYVPQFKLTDEQQITYTGLRSEQWFWHEEKQLCIDLHWSILPKYYSFTPTPELVWAKIDRFNFAEDTIATLSPEHLLLFLCAHGAKHNWSRLYWICDLAELLRTNNDLDWQSVKDTAGKFGTYDMLLLGLYLARHLLDAELPASMSSAIGLDPTLPLLADRIRANLFSDELIDPSAPNSSNAKKSDAIYRQTMGTIRDRVWYWIDLILTPTPLEWEIVTLPRSLSPLYYIVRAFRLVIKHTWKLDI
jgi:Uncharacterised nucleotidyltransferase